ncbi:glycoside hydrolase family 88 protein [Microbacterium sp. 13-71-7]|uniref:glycoside hydrolase family 88 protein n=1 Tax=Microbacterium sp. 13-71-7 TaxID=1970399 RepID=UPI000BC65148|nr:glycoside hydrolase family 88 protein [Microbacterium sp. 13-71-7]OZB83609.1 MAG: hypothetical protein B7X32_09790 [Microbacterium sp. 13-71-7]
MAGEDLSSSELAEPPLPPLTREGFADVQHGLEDAVREATRRQGISRWFWGEGVCLLALVRLSRARGEQDPAEVAAFMDSFRAAPPVLEHVNNLAPGAALAELHRRDPRPEYRSLLDACLAWYETAPEATRDAGGALEHWPGGVWADTVYMAGQFLLRAGTALERQDLVSEAERQWIAHAELLQDEATGLLAHGTHQGVRIPCHWGRANAWFALSGADILAVTGSPEVRQRLTLLLESAARRQPEHGVWDVLLDDAAETRGILETSAAAGLGAALLRTAALSEDEAVRGRLAAAGERAVLGSLSYVRDGLLTRVSAGTILQLIPFGYSVIRDDRPQPWGQGLTMEALAAWRETAHLRKEIPA